MSCLRNKCPISVHNVIGYPHNHCIRQKHPERLIVEHIGLKVKI